MKRRRFLEIAASTPALALAACTTPVKNSSSTAPAPSAFFFTSQGKTAMMKADGSGLRYLAFDVPNQATWQPCAVFPDGHRVLFLSMEPRRDGPGKPFDEYYHQTPTHIWIYDLHDESLIEIANQTRIAPFYTPQVLLDNGRMLVQVVRDKVAQILNMKLDGSDAFPFTREGEGMPYGFDLSPDGKRVAYHIASPKGYQIWTCDTDGSNRIRVAGHPDYLFFSPQWSPDGAWLAYQGCRYKTDPGHDWSDLFLGRPDGSEQRLLTEGQALWFGATYGPADNRGGGSNIPTWSNDGTVLCSRRLPGARVPWAYQAQRRDTDHFNREFMPDQACGGTEICKIHPDSGEVTRITHSDPPVWDFRQTESPDGKQILFCRAATGESPGIWIAHADGSKARLLTTGYEGRGADHPRWIA